MAQSAGKRTASPIIRFEDEFGSLGSNPTPELVEKKESDFFRTWSEDNDMLNKMLYTRGPHTAHAQGVRAILQNQGHPPSVKDFLYRSLFAASLAPHLADELTHVLAYYAPYYMCDSSMEEEVFFREHCEFDVDSTVDHYEAQPDYIRSIKGVHQRRVMEEIEKCALIAYSDWMVETEYNEEGDEEDFDWEYTSRQALYRIQTAFQCNPLIRRSFSKSVALNFLATAIAFRQASLMYNVYHGRPALDIYMGEFDY